MKKNVELLTILIALIRGWPTNRCTNFTYKSSKKEVS